MLVLKKNLDIKTEIIFELKINKRFAYIDFERTESLYSAIKLHGRPLKGREIRVDVETRKPRLGYKLPKDQESRYSKQ